MNTNSENVNDRSSSEELNFDNAGIQASHQEANENQNLSEVSGPDCTPQLCTLTGLAKEKEAIDPNRQCLQAVWIKDDRPSRIMAFTETCESISLHFDAKQRGYVICLGADECPYCRLDYKPSVFYLTPVYNLLNRKVEILQISDRMGPDTLFSNILPFVKRGDLPNRMLEISKKGKGYAVRSRRLPEDVDNGADEIAAFESAWESGEIDLRSPLLKLRREEIENLPHIKHELSLVGPMPE